MVEITRFPRAPRYVEGIINLRGEIVPVLSLQRLFGWPFQGDVLGMYIIVGDVAGRRIGLIADSVATMCEVAGEQLEAPSGADRLAALLSWVAKLDDGIMFVLDFERVAAVKDNPDFAVSMGSDQGPTAGLQEGLSLPVQAALRERARELRERATPEEIELKLFFTFALGAERYAIDVGNVAKVLPLPHITAVPGTPTHFAGMINHAGDILWVLDIKELLGLSATLPGNDERIVVVDYERIRFGFLVDAAHDVVSFPIKAVRPALAAEKVKDDYVSAEIYWRDDLLAVLDLAVLARAAGESAPA
jgi:purine-binding chemotaxis protein CheW